MTAKPPSSARCAAVLLLSVPAIGRPAAASPDEGSPLWTIGAARDVVGAGVVQAHEIAFDRDALAGLRIDDRVRLALVGGDAVTGVIERRDAQSDARFTVSGRVLEAIGPGSFLIAIHGNGCAGSISMGDAGTFRIRGAADGALLIERLDASGLPWCEVAPGDAAPDLPPGDPPAAPAGGATGSCDDGSIIDLLVVYTREARDAAGGGENIDAEIDLLVAAMNGAFESSEVAPRIRLVYARELSTPEDELTLNNLAGTDDGVIDGVHRLRDAYGADQVALVKSGGGGVALGLDSLDPANERWAFCVCGRDSMPFIIAHEVGHNLGCCHAVGDGGGCSVGLLFQFSNGHRFTGDSGTEWRTVMAYTPGVWSGIYSNPDVEFDGVPQGLDVEIPPGADNALTINLAAPVVATWRASSSICTDLDLAADAADCNANDVPDACEIATGLSHDVDHDGTPDECMCPVDIDFDGGVGFDDLLAVLSSWDSVGGPADVDGSGVVDGGDVDLILAEWGRCVPVNGACCFSDRICSRETETTCGAAGGVYLGDDSTCEECPVGACCLVDDGCCTIETEGGCASRGGVHSGAGTTCAEACPTGACCIPSEGRCVETLEATCIALGGDFRGAGTVCADECPEGACCFLDGTCEQLLGATCVDAGGMFHAGSACPRACRPADDCADAPAVGEASIPFSTLAATTDGPNLPPGCGEGGDGILLRKDVWIVYVASCGGTATVSVCESDFDTRLAVYETGGCPGTLIDCNDDACGEDGTRSRVAFPVVANGSYLVRIGSVDSRGEGTLVLECSGLP